MKTLVIYNIDEFGLLRSNELYVWDGTDTVGLGVPANSLLVATEDGAGIIIKVEVPDNYEVPEILGKQWEVT